jgi:ribosomal-protein-alanine N-acetyltransferase
MLREREEPQTIYGSINLTGITQGAFHAANLGYSLDATRTGRGYMTEALEEVIRFAFDELNLHRVAASHMPENKSSARVLEKLSFVREGYAADYLFIAGAWRDHVLCSRTNPDFQMPTSEG